MIRMISAMTRLSCLLGIAAGMAPSPSEAALGIGCRGDDELVVQGNKQVCVSLSPVKCTFGDLAPDHVGNIDKCIKDRRTGTEVIRDTRCGVLTERIIHKAGVDACRDEYLPLPRR